MPSFRYIVPLTGDRGFGRSILGGKGHNLQRLVYENFHVPGGFVITTEAYREVLRGLVRGARDWDGIEEFGDAVSAVPLPPQLEEEILRAARALKTITGGALVVRSSATSEDHAQGSMAGQAATFMNILTEDELVDSVRGCWASLFGRESLTYRSRGPATTDLPEMAVVVQQLVPADRAGVLFTRDPVSGDGDRMIVSASWGLGETVVAGKASDTVAIDCHSGAILEAEIANKTEQHLPRPEGGTVVESVPTKDATRPVVDHSFAVRLHALGLRVERVFGVPQDIEWAEWSGRLYLLQARPVTANARPRRTVWSNTNVGEALPGVGTPFTWGFIKSFSRKGLVHAFKGLGCTVPEDYPIVGNIRGRVYMNLSEFMSVSSQVPFVTPDTLQRLAGGGGAEALPGTYEAMPRTRFLARFPLTAVSQLLSRTITPARIALWSQRFKAFSREFATRHPGSLSRQELVDWWQRTHDLFEETGTLTLECSGEFLMGYLLTSMALRLAVGARSGQFERELFSGLSGIRSAEPGLDLLRMARRVKQIPSLQKRVAALRVDDLLPKLSAGDVEERSLHSAFEAFLRGHGHRAAREAEISEPRWREDPTFPLLMLQRYVESPDLPDPEEMVRRRIEDRERATRLAASSVTPALRPLFLRLLRQTQEAARLREEMRNSVVHTLGFIRTLALETGRHMVHAGLLSQEEDVFFLDRLELLAWLNGTEDAGRLPLLAVMRKLEHEALVALPDLPQWFVLEGDHIVSDEHAEVQEGRTITGLAGSPGVATGRVAIVRDPSEQQKVAAGDILVAPFTDVGWTPLFLVAGAVVTELGGPLSHSCVVAREYGVPAVVNIKDVTRILQDGDIVTVDGTRGVIVLKQTS
jgi:rifampicin phosphotransferase